MSIKKSYAWILSKMWKYSPKSMIGEIVCVIFIGIGQPALTFILQYMVDAISTSKIMEGCILAIAYVCGLSLQGVIVSLREYMKAMTQKNLGKGLQQDIAQKYLQIEYSVFEDTKNQDILQQIAEKPYEQILDIYTHTLDIFLGGFSFLGYLCLLTQVGVVIPISFITLSLVNMYFSHRAIILSSNLSYDQTADEREMDYLGELLQNKSSLMELKLFEAVNYIMYLWKKQSDKVLRYRLKTTVKAQMLFLMGGILTIVWIGFLLAILIFKISIRSITLGMFISLVNCATSMIVISNIFSEHAHNISKKITLVRLYIEFEMFPERKVCYRKKNKKIESGIEFQNVSFHYPGNEHWVLDDVSFSVSLEECVAIVGENGAGKSTILKLVCGLYIPQKGQVLINGRNASDYTDAELKEVLGVVFQNFEKFHFTVRQNVAMCIEDDNALEDLAVKEALCAGGCNELCECLECQLGTEESGLDLSKGQWQRLAISRALYGDEKYLLLDEPTSAIDPIAESEMYECFRNAFQKKGGIIISHRLASTRVADWIIVLSKGKIAEKGTYDELINENGIFAQMWEAQSHWYIKGDEHHER